MVSLNNPVISKMRGFSLVELMVAALLSLLIMVGVVQIFISNKHTYNTQQGLSQVQESGRFAMHFLGKEIRNVGYTGCGNLERLEKVVIQASPPPVSGDFNLGASLKGFKDGQDAAGADWVNPIPTSSDQYYPYVAGTDILEMSGMSPDAVTLMGKTDVNNGNIFIGGNEAGFEDGDILMITDCQTADIFCANNVSNWDPETDTVEDKVTMSHPASCNVGSKLSKTYGDDSSVAFFVKKTLYIGTGDSGEPALILLDNVKLEADVLVEGISDMQMLFGIDNVGDDRIVDQYVDADSITTSDDWAQVLSVRVGIIAESTNEVFPDDIDVSLELPAGTVNFEDKVMRQAFNSTFALRNRLP